MFWIVFFAIVFVGIANFIAGYNYGKKKERSLWEWKKMDEWKGSPHP